MKKMLIFIRNGLAFTYAWLVLCVAIVSLIFKNSSISVLFLLKLLALCAAAVICFTLCFLNPKMQKKGFIFSLTVFFAVFIPLEILMFYVMGIFTGAGSIAMWIIFGVIVVLSYIACLVTDFFLMKKRAGIYTQKLKEYNSKTAI